MPKTIQLRNVPDDLYRKLKLRALEADITLSDFLVRELAALEDYAALPASVALPLAVL